MRAGAEAQLAATDDAIESQIASRRAANRQNARIGNRERTTVGDIQAEHPNVCGTDIWLRANIGNNHVVDCRIGNTWSVLRSARWLGPVGGRVPVSVS